MHAVDHVSTESARPASILDRISDEATQMGVALDAWEDFDRIDLHWLARQPGTSLASSAHVMDMLCAYADTTQRFILLQAEDEVYAEWGFVALPEMQAEDYFPKWRQTLIRRPMRFGFA
jgi:hypothetical protein